MKNKIILTDADGVLVNWLAGFHDWAQHTKKWTLIPGTESEFYIENRYNEVTDGMAAVEEFNASSHLRHLEAWPGAVRNVKKLVDDGYRFHVITAISKDLVVKDTRCQNLVELFGDVFYAITCVGAFESKTQQLEEYADSECWWLEDMPKHAQEGHKLGLRSILLEDGLNADFKTDDFPIVNTWDEIYETIQKGNIAT